MEHNLYHKTGIIIKELCYELLDKQVGDRIESVSTYAQNFKAANGTVQNAFKYLKDHKAIKTISKGHLGSFISYININKLIEISGHRDIIGVMPLPYSRLYQGFATAIYLDAHANDIDLQMAFMRGAQSRLKMLLTGKYDFVTMSMLSANYYLDLYDDLEIAIKFGPHSYLREHAMVFLDHNNNEVKDGMKIGIDYSSKDMEIITKHQCQNFDVQYISLPYIQLLNKIKTKEIDMAIMNADDIKDRQEDLNLVPIDNKFFKYSDSEAVIVVLKSNKFTKSIISKTLNSDRILHLQRGVIKGDIEAIY